MAESTALGGYGTLFKREIDGAPGTYATIAEVRQIGGPKLGLATKEVTHMESPNAWDEHIGTIKSGGEISLALSFVPNNAGHVNLRADLASRVKHKYQMVFPSATGTWSFSAICTSFEPSVSPENEISASVNFKVTGEPTFA